MTNYERVEAELRRLRLDSTLSALHRAIDDEAEALRIGGSLGATSRRQRTVFEAQARVYYGDEIVECFSDPRPLGPGQILGLRRKPTAWAIAAIIRDAGGKL